MYPGCEYIRIPFAPRVCAHEPPQVAPVSDDAIISCFGGWDLNQITIIMIHSNQVGGFKYFVFSPLLGEDSYFDYDFSDGLKPPSR